MAQNPASTRRRPANDAPEVVVTGIGAVLPGATGAQELWQHLRDGASQITTLTRYTPPPDLPGVAAQIEGFDHRKFLSDLDEHHAAKYSREVLVTMSAVKNALDDAALRCGDVDPRRTCLFDSSSRGPLEWWSVPDDGTPRTRSVGAMLNSLPGTPAALAAIYSGIQGMVTTLSSACVGGHQALALGIRALRAGEADVVLAGGHEFPLLPAIARMLDGMGRGVLARGDGDPAQAMKPYDRKRDGFVLGEGAVVLCLEREQDARARGADPYARILFEGSLNEAAHPTTMDTSGAWTSALVGDLLQRAGRVPGELDFVLGHGTATRYNDVAESRTLARLFAGRPDCSWPPLISIKPVYGHLLGAAGTLNAAAAALMLRHQCLAPTANLTDPDPECGGDHVAEGARPARLDLAASLAFAIGSQTSALLLASM